MNSTKLLPPKRSASTSRFGRTSGESTGQIHPPPRRPSPYARSKTSRTSGSAQKHSPGVHSEVFGGFLNYQGKGLKSFSDIEIPSDVTKINFKKNEIQSFAGMPLLSRLQSLDISDNPITSLRGLHTLPKLTEISLLRTPYASKENFRIALLALCGPSLKKINEQRVSASERQLAGLYKGPYEELLRAGWDLKYPPPKGAEIKAIKQKLFAESASVARQAKPKPTATQRPRLQSEVLDGTIKQQRTEIAHLRDEIQKLTKDTNR